jgi:hypothetical protein
VALQGFWVLKAAEYMGETTGQDPTDEEDYLRHLLRLRQPEERELPIDFRKERTP